MVEFMTPSDAKDLLEDAAGQPSPVMNAAIEGLVVDEVYEIAGQPRTLLSIDSKNKFITFSTPGKEGKPVEDRMGYFTFMSRASGKTPWGEALAVQTAAEVAAATGEDSAGLGGTKE